MMTLEEIKQLNAGDVIERTYSGAGFLTRGRRYDVKNGVLGLHIIDDDGDRYDMEHLRTNRERWSLVEKKDTDFPFHIEQLSVDSFTSAIEVKVVTDRAGLARLREIEESVKKRSDLQKLRQQREEITAKIKELEGDD